MTRIHGDEWHGVSSRDWSIEHPSADDLDRLLDRLDARTYTLLTIQRAGGKHLSVGGGSGRYVVYATLDDARDWTLLRRGAGTGTILVNAGGQEGDYPAEQVVAKEQARAAARAFFESGDLDPSQEWHPG